MLEHVLQKYEELSPLQKVCVAAVGTSVVIGVGLELHTLMDETGRDSNDSRTLENSEVRVPVRTVVTAPASQVQAYEAPHIVLPRTPVDHMPHLSDKVYMPIALGSYSIATVGITYGIRRHQRKQPVVDRSPGVIRREFEEILRASDIES
jgi:hypothetical protein